MQKQINKGSIALKRCQKSHAAVAAACGTTEAAVSYWSTGDRRPGALMRAELQSFLGIPIGDWDVPFIEPAKPTKPGPRMQLSTPQSSCTTEVAQLPARLSSQAKRRAAYGPGATIEFAKKLYLEQQRLHEELAEDPTATPAERLKVYSQLAKNLKQIGDMTGEFLPSEAKILQTQQWQNIQAAMVRALLPYPEAMEALLNVLEGFSPPATN